MSLLVDPDYVLHSLRLNYLRRLADPCAPHLISFSSHQSVDVPSAPLRIADAALANPYIQLAGLADPERWPELLVKGSPPDNVPHFEGRRRRRKDDGLRYSETIVGKGAGGAGMRVSGKRGSRRHRDEEVQGEAGIGAPPQASETAFAIAEGRHEVGPGGLDPEESDDDDDDFQPHRHERQDTADTVKGRQRSSVTFSPDTQSESPGQRHRRATFSSMRMTAMSDASILRRSSGAPTIDSPVEEDGDDDDDGMETPQRRASQPTVPASAPTGGSAGERFYADPDKRLSDMLFKAGAPSRHHQTVGSVQLEPAPLEGVEEEPDSSAPEGSKRTRTLTDASTVSSSDLGYAATDSSIGKSLSNTYGGQSLSDLAAIPEAAPAEEKPVMRRERRRVNIKLGDILKGQPPALADAASGSPQAPPRVQTGSPGRSEKSVSPRPSLPDMRNAAGGSAGRARAKTTPTPLREEIVPAKRERAAQLTFAKQDVAPPKPAHSGLTRLLTAQKASPALDNPFRTFYASLAARDRDQRDALKVTVWFPFARDSGKPLKMALRSDVCIEEVVGFALWRYVEEAKEPKLDEVVEGQEGDTSPWNLRLVEDDGEVDEDFPALERIRPAAKVGSTEFAVVAAPPDQASQNAAAQLKIQRRPSRILQAPNHDGSQVSLAPPPVGDTPPMSSSVIPTSNSASALDSVYLRIRIPSFHRGVEAITTTLNVPTDMYLADVLEHVCKKKDLGAAREWALVVPQGASSEEVVVPLDRTVEGLQGVNLLALVKRSKVASALRQTRGNANPSASIFKRLSEPPQPRYVTASDLTTTFKSYAVQTKRRGILGKQERTLSLDGDYVHIGPGGLAGGAAGKTSSYHASSIEDIARRGQHGVRLVVWRDSEKKRYEVEVADPKVAAEIVSHVRAMVEAAK